MNNGNCCGIACRTWATIAGIVGALLIFVGLAWVLRHYTTPAPIASNRAEERQKNLTELRAASDETLRGFGWADQAKGVVRIPIEQAMRMTLDDYKNPGAFRSNMVLKIDKLTAPPPKAPEQPSAFE